MAASYNATGKVATLVGNWSEEAGLKSLTGTSRTSTGGGVASDPTHTRVVEHSEQLAPSEWRTTNSTSFQAPAARSHEAASYAPAKQMGPREAREMQELLKAARISDTPAPAASSFETTHQAEFAAHDLSGLSVGARVMKTASGGPVQRDPTFLSEAQLVAPGQAGRMGGPLDTLLKARMGDPCLPITCYTEAAAKSTFNGQFYGTAILSKFQPMNRNDQFTKLMGDVNKQ